MTIFSLVKDLAVTKYTLNHWCNRMGHRQKKGAKGANSDKVKGKRVKKKRMIREINLQKEMNWTQR